MKLAPSTLVPGKAANRVPGRTARLSAVSAWIWTSLSLSEICTSSPKSDPRRRGPALRSPLTPVSSLGEGKRHSRFGLRVEHLGLDTEHRSDPADDVACRGGR